MTEAGRETIRPALPSAEERSDHRKNEADRQTEKVKGRSLGECVKIDKVHP